MFDRGSWAGRDGCLDQHRPATEYYWICGDIKLPTVADLHHSSCKIIRRPQAIRGACPAHCTLNKILLSIKSNKAQLDVNIEIQIDATTSVQYI